MNALAERNWLRTPEAELAEDKTDADVRAEIERYMDDNPVQLGCFGEAINEHELFDEMRETFYQGDTNRLGVLAEKMFREYLGKVIEQDMP